MNSLEFTYPEDVKPESFTVTNEYKGTDITVKREDRELFYISIGDELCFYNLENMEDLYKGLGVLLGAN